MVENFDEQTSRQGLFSPMADGTTHNGVPVYEQSSGDQQMWYNGAGASYGWSIGMDYSSGYSGINSLVCHSKFRCTYFLIEGHASKLT